MSAVIQTLTNREYHARTAISAHRLMLFQESPQRYYAQYVARTEPPDPPTPAMQLGTALHALILEPERFDLEVLEAPPWAGSRGTKLWQQFASEHPDCVLVTAAERRRLAAMAAALRAAAGEWLSAPGETELSVFWDDAETGLRLMSRIDKLLLYPTEVCVLDVKTAADASSAGFWKARKRYRYGIQEAMYVAAGRACVADQVKLAAAPVTFRYLVTQNRAPFQAAVYRTPPAELRAMERVRRTLLKRLAECYETGVWK